jgi:hypothetical protein
LTLHETLGALAIAHKARGVAKVFIRKESHRHTIAGDICSDSKISLGRLYRPPRDPSFRADRIGSGITGLAQVNGMRGETETTERLVSRTKYDLDYVRRASLWLDLKIIWKTCLKVIKEGP